MAEARCFAAWCLLYKSFCFRRISLKSRYFKFFQRAYRLSSQQYDHSSNKTAVASHLARRQQMIATSSSTICSCVPACEFTIPSESIGSDCIPINSYAPIALSPAAAASCARIIACSQQLSPNAAVGACDGNFLNLENGLHLDPSMQQPQSSSFSNIIARPDVPIEDSLKSPGHSSFSQQIHTLLRLSPHYSKMQQAVVVFRQRRLSRLTLHFRSMYLIRRTFSLLKVILTPNSSAATSSLSTTAPFTSTIQQMTKDFHPNHSSSSRRLLNSTYPSSPSHANPSVSDSLVSYASSSESHSYFYERLIDIETLVSSRHRRRVQWAVLSNLRRHVSSIKLQQRSFFPQTSACLQAKSPFLPAEFSLTHHSHTLSPPASDASDVFLRDEASPSPAPRTSPLEAAKLPFFVSTDMSFHINAKSSCSPTSTSPLKARDPILSSDASDKPKSPLLSTDTSSHEAAKSTFSPTDIHSLVSRTLVSSSTGCEVDAPLPFSTNAQKTTLPRSYPEVHHHFNSDSSHISDSNISFPAVLASSIETLPLHLQQPESSVPTLIVASAPSTSSSSSKSSCSLANASATSSVSSVSFSSAHESTLTSGTEPDFLSCIEQKSISNSRSPNLAVTAAVDLLSLRSSYSVNSSSHASDSSAVARLPDYDTSNDTSGSSFPQFSPLQQLGVFSSEHCTESNHTQSKQLVPTGTLYLT
jgi:hypothetical protein